MPDKFKNKYRIPSARLQNWDYGWNAAYFITICTRDRQHYFGNIVNGRINLSHTGVVADLFWNEIKNHAEHVELGAYVVMPNHVHGIIIVNNPMQNDKSNNMGGINDTGTDGNDLGDGDNVANGNDVVGDVDNGNAIYLSFVAVIHCSLLV